VTTYREVLRRSSLGDLIAVLAMLAALAWMLIAHRSQPQPPQPPQPSRTTITGGARISTTGTVPANVR
jgi:hypothetical protein